MKFLWCATLRKEGGRGRERKGEGGKEGEGGREKDERMIRERERETDRQTDRETERSIRSYQYIGIYSTSPGLRIHS